MQILNKQTSLFGETELTSLQADSLASHSVLPGSEKAQKMTAISGQKCLEQFKRFNRATSWAKTFVGLLIGGGGLVFDQVLSDLENEGYEVTPFLLPACGVNAPHRRDRIWIVAFNSKFKSNGGHNTRTSSRERMEMDGNELGQTGRNESSDNHQSSDSNGATANTSSDRRKWERQRIENENRQPGSEHTGIMEGRLEGLCSHGSTANANGQCMEGRTNERGIREVGKKPNEQPSRFLCPDWENFPTQPPICSGNDGFSDFMDTDTFFRSIGVEHPRKPAIGFAKWRNESIKAFGNAWVPQVAYEIFKVINQMEFTI